MKQTPKSCSCQQCRFARHSKTGHFFGRVEEHAFRRATKAALKRVERGMSRRHHADEFDPDWQPDVLAAPRGERLG